VTQAFRIAGGRLVAGDRPIRFRFDGQAYEGLAGDTLASALLANGVHLMGRSFKYHRPRGVLSAGSDEPNALVTVRRDDARVTPNLRATQVELYEGLEATSQNRWPSLGFDVGAVNDVFGRFITAGFYYKTFMWPRKAWDRLYEPLIRRAAGLGEAPTRPDPDRYAHRYAHCDVLVVGSGPAGLAAALQVSRSGARVILCDEQPAFGGSLLCETEATIDAVASAAWLERTLAELAANPKIRMLNRCQAFGYFAHNMIGLAQRLTDHLPSPPPGAVRERLWQVRARRVVIAAGAHERPLVFPGNDRPGVMLSGAARRYLDGYGVKVGRRAVVATTCDQAYDDARALRAAGVEVAAIVDLRAEPPPAANAGDIPVFAAHTIAHTTGRRRIQSVTIAPAEGSVGGRTIACDALLMSGGFTPSLHLFSQSRGKMRWDAAIDAFVPDQSAEAEQSAGACRGIYGLADVLLDGAEAGRQAAVACGFAAAGDTPIAENRSWTGGRLGAAPLAAANSGKAFVDLQNDVTTKDLAQAVQEGFRSIEHVKRYTTTGMATDQGKTSNINALAEVARLTGRSIPEVGLTTFRMPYTPVTFGALAGVARRDLFDPVRTAPMHGWAEARGAVFEDVGLWKRARYFPQGAEAMEAAVARECAAVRGACGLFDASTLGKIEVVGPDAAEFMNRMYVNAWTRLEPGRCRYGVLLREDGFVLDDGVVGRLAADRFHVTTTTGGAARVLALMEDYLQTEWPDLDVWLTSVTEQWGVIAVQGPLARRILAPLVEGVDISSEAFPHMSIGVGSIRGAPMRLMRVSFTGELGYEVNVPASQAPAVWEAIWAAGQPLGMAPYGTEAMHVLRAEKGFIIVGQETDGTATPDDVGLGWAIGKSKRDFVGKRSLARQAMQRADRKQLVGLLTGDPKLVLEEGMQIVEQAGGTTPLTMIGHVTSSYASPTLGRSIALAMISGGRGRLGQILYAARPGGDAQVSVVSPVFYDPGNERANA
jgi:sarcosine oxidase subunit alpha